LPVPHFGHATVGTAATAGATRPDASGFGEADDPKVLAMVGSSAAAADGIFAPHDWQ
jgi:hypothetical protein